MEGRNGKIRKYIGTAIVGTGFSLGVLGNSYAFDSNIPSFNQSVEQTYQERKMRGLEGISNEEKERGEIIVEMADSLKKCNDSINEGILDGIYTLPEQERTLTYYREMLRGYSNRNRKNFYSFPSREKEIHRFLLENIRGIDTDKPELQKYFEKEGKIVSVERNPSEIECIGVGLGALFGLLGGILGISYLADRKIGGGS